MERPGDAGTLAKQKLPKEPGGRKEKSRKVLEGPRDAGTLAIRKLCERSREAATASDHDMHSMSDINATLSSGA